jgi:hypothetical protein
VHWRGSALLVLLVSPQDLAACASCANSVNQVGIMESERYGYVPEVPRSARPRPPPPAPKGRVRVALRDGDVVEVDEANNVTAIRHATSPPTWTRFKPGAVSPREASWVEGELRDAP